MDMKTILKNTIITLALPVGMFLLMLVLTRINGVVYFGSTDMWRTILNNLSLTVPVALAIALQLRFGRMDFSGGITMILSGLLGVMVAQQFGNNPIIMLTVSIVCSLMISMVTATIYTFGRIPIIICTVALTLLYESFTLLIGDGTGVSIISNTSLNVFGRMPINLIILGVTIIFYHFVTTYTVSSRKAMLLNNGQQVAVNIGINERKNVFIIYGFTGILFGLAGVVYTSQNIVLPQSNLSTAAILFSYIVPVFVGLFLGKYSLEIIGIIIGSLSIQFMNYGLSALGYGSGGWDNILFGIFMMAFWTLTVKGDSLKRLFTVRRRTKKESLV
jgi:ribose/xylose/arabinose/galactoside ABC-type transport system permease subunit